MTKRFLAALATATLSGTLAHAQDDDAPPFFLDGTSPEVVERIKVTITDGAEGGCWTNLGEAKTYAEDQLRLKGYAITEEVEWGTWRLNVFVNSGRNGALCYGYRKVELYAWTRDHGTLGAHLIGSKGGTFANHQNANVLILDLIKEAIDQFPER